MPFPKRFFVGLLLLIGFTTNNFQRGSFAIAILQIKDETPTWSETVQGLILASFFWGYICTTGIGGWLCSRFGPKLVTLWSTCIASVLYILLPFAVPNIGATISVYLLIGLVQGVYVPGLYSILSNWYPISEHSTITAVMNVGAALGFLVSFGAGPFIILAARWPSIFFVAGGCGLLWSILWGLFVTDLPGMENTLWPINKEERDYITADQGAEGTTKDDPPPTPWKKLLTNPAVWALYLAHFSGNWGQYVFSSWMPTYLKEELDYDIAESGIFSLLPFILMGVTNIFAGWFSDFIINNGWISKTRSRKAFQILVSVQAVCFFILGAMELTALEVVAMFCISIGLLGFAGGGSDVGFLDLTNYHTAILFGVSNTIATLPGVLGVYAVGFLLDATDQGWQITFYFSGALCVFTMIIWLLFASAEPVLDDIHEQQKLVPIDDQPVVLET